MKQDETILSELRQISPSLAELPRVTATFTVPQGYFEALSARLLVRLNTASSRQPLPEGPSSLPPASETTAPLSGPPAGYFENLSARLIQKLHAMQQTGLARDPITEELGAISPLLAGLQPRTPYQVPEGYFEALPAVVAQSGSTDNALRNPEHMKYPTPYRVPVGYFESLPTVMSRRLVPRGIPKAKLLVLGYNQPWMRYAAAAVMIGVFATLGFFSLTSHPFSGADPAAALKKMSDQEILSYVETQDIPLAEATGNAAAVGKEESSDLDTRELFHGIPDEDLRLYDVQGSTASKTE